MVFAGSEVSLFCMCNEACVILKIHYKTKFYSYHFWSHILNHNVRFADIYREMTSFIFKYSLQLSGSN
jgi:hypothetical protein